MKWFLSGLLVMVVLLVIALFVFQTPDTDRKAMIAKYTNDQSKFIDTPDGRIHYRDQGPRNAPALLLVHGSSSSLHTWEPVIDILKDRYRLITFDMPGHGLTGPSKTRDYRAGALIRAATNVLDAAGVESATWVGSSMGGWVAWRAALDVPGRVNGLVLIGAVGAQTNEEFKPYLGARIAKSWLGGHIMPRITPIWIVRSSVEETMANPAQVTDAVVMRYWDLLRFPGNRQAVVDRERADREPAAWSRIGSLQTPVLLIWGDKDNVVPTSFGKAFEKAITGSSLVIMNETGHLPMEERPKDVADMLDKWIEQSVLQRAASMPTARK